MDSSAAYNLQRFLRAQEGVYDQVCDELRRGKKYGHWMWFIFPQIQGLGSSPTVGNGASGRSAPWRGRLTERQSSGRTEGVGQTRIPPGTFQEIGDRHRMN